MTHGRQLSSRQSSHIFCRRALQSCHPSIRSISEAEQFLLLGPGDSWVLSSKKLGVQIAGKDHLGCSLPAQLFWTMTVSCLFSAYETLTWKYSGSDTANVHLYKCRKLPLKFYESGSDLVTAVRHVAGQPGPDPWHFAWSPEHHQEWPLITEPKVSPEHCLTWHPNKAKQDSTKENSLR